MQEPDYQAPHASSGWLHRLLRLVVDVRPGETRAMLWGAFYYFALMASYYPLKAIRDEIGSRDGAEGLSELFTATFIGMLLVVPIFSWLVSRVRRRTLLPLVYVFFTLNILGFYVLFRFSSSALAGVEFWNHDGNWWLAAGYFVWVSVYNLFVVSVFWGFMADLFRAGQGKRLFGFIAAGASVGAVAGSAIASIKMRDSYNLMLISAALLAVAILCVWRLGRHDRAGEGEGDRGKEDDNVVGGNWWDAFVAVARSPYLIGIAGYILFYTATSTLLYFFQAEVVYAAFEGRDARTAVFGRIYLATNILSMIVAAIITGRLMHRMGVSLVLVILPTITLIGFAILTVAQNFAPAGTMWWGYAAILWVFLPFTVIRSASNYAMAKPAREVLFTVVSRAEKYKAKIFIDTAVYRGGDVATAWALEPLRKAGGLLAMTGVGVPLALAWIILGFFLGRAQHRRQQRDAFPKREFKPVFTPPAPPSPRAGL